jgi:heat-inducible transcriptional repressor
MPARSTTARAEEPAHAERLQRDGRDGLHGLGPRLRDVLIAVLEEYVSTARPVASQRALLRSGLALSSATVRSAMVELSERGLLQQPHTSAGRVPTDGAFRLYVDHLLAQRPEPAAPAPELEEQSGSLDDWLRRLAERISLETGQLGFLVRPGRERQLLARLHFVRVSSERVLGVLVFGRGSVESRLIEERECDQRELDRFSARLSERVAGLRLDEARERLLEAVRHERARRDALWHRALRLGRLCLGGAEAAEGAEGELFVGDHNHLLSQPEFRDLERLRDVLAALAEKERMLRLLDQLLEADRLQVMIGEELEAPDMRGCAVVTAPLGEELPVGGFGVIGPVRMPYERVIPVVQGLRERLRRAIC